MTLRFLNVFALSAGLSAALSLAGPALAGTTGPADLVLMNGRITTEDASRPAAEALAVIAGKLVYVGDTAGVKAFIGPRTRIEDASGRRVLPGLHGCDPVRSRRSRVAVFQLRPRATRAGLDPRRHHRCRADRIC